MSVVGAVPCGEGRSVQPTSPASQRSTAAKKPNARQSFWSALAQELQPVGPIAGELEEILEVAQSVRFELGDDIDKRVFSRDWSDRDERTLDAEFLGRQSEARVNARSTQTGS